MGKRGPNITFNLFFLGLGRPWVGAFVGFIIIFIFFQPDIIWYITNTLLYQTRTRVRCEIGDRTGRSIVSSAKMGVLVCVCVLHVLNFNGFRGAKSRDIRCIVPGMVFFLSWVFSCSAAVFGCGCFYFSYCRSVVVVVVVVGGGGGGVSLSFIFVSSPLASSRLILSCLAPSLYLFRRCLEAGFPACRTRAPFISTADRPTTDRPTSRRTDRPNNLPVADRPSTNQPTDQLTHQ